MFFGRITDTVTEKTENLSYEEKEQNADNSLILMSFQQDTENKRTHHHTDANVYVPSQRPVIQNEGKNCKVPIPNNGRIPTFVPLILPNYYTHGLWTLLCAAEIQRHMRAY
ncbi:hypothetical protein AAES_137744 [Amazona aestiva]|uniref:Uncharacterized protein n=1 Tax=Amazona aestiva TaxID=12930 RepID=A0A0Q3QT16_AMAAE|nr:hypothetical protein AAES_137744 [Amazona aestiva]